MAGMDRYDKKMKRARRRELHKERDDKHRRPSKTVSDEWELDEDY